jgi:hypothetical protein
LFLVRFSSSESIRSIGLQAVIIQNSAGKDSSLGFSKKIVSKYALFISQFPQANSWEKASH